MIKQAQFIPEDQPNEVTVNGEGLRAWTKDARVHVYRMIVKEPGIYLLSLFWLNGRQLVDCRTQPKPVMPGPAIQRELVKEAQKELFLK